MINKSDIFLSLPLIECVNHLEPQFLKSLDSCPAEPILALILVTNSLVVKLYIKNKIRNIELKRKLLFVVIVYYFGINFILRFKQYNYTHY